MGQTRHTFTATLAGETTTKEVQMFHQLTSELLDLAAEVRGDSRAPYAMSFDCCSCSCCGCVFNC
jgi:hypothetical protein